MEIILKIGMDNHMHQSKVIDGIFKVLPDIKDYHAKTSPLYKYLSSIIEPEIKILFSGTEPQAVNFSDFGEIIFPFVSMGAISSLNLFELDELIIFSFYLKNKHRYKNTLDIGANIGLHSLIMAKCGFNVSCYEPDPIHFEILTRNLKMNNITNVIPHNKAMSTHQGEAEFIRVCGNTTGSHLAGCKKNPYGKLDCFPVELEAFKPLMHNAELIKMDVEGHEKEIILSTAGNDWINTDMFVEIENIENREEIFNHLCKINVNMFPQKINWREAVKAEDLPSSYKDGMLFVSRQETMSW